MNKLPDKLLKEWLFVVPCSATKSRILATEPMPAREAYTGQAFRLCRDSVSRHRLKWCILSGGYGFIWPSTVIESYYEKMERVTDETVWHDCFSHINNRQYGRLMTAKNIMVLGSRLYANAAKVLLGRNVVAPFAGLSIGRMLSAIRQERWLNEAIKA
jgi:hypothetical protein